MAEYTIEEREPYTLMRNGSFQGPSENKTSCLQDAQRGDKQIMLCCMFLTSLLINLIVMSVAIVVSERRRKTLPERPCIRVESCPDGWIGFQRRCYYFAEVDRNWTSSRRECSSFNASLAVIDSQEEMEFIRRYKGLADHWIGLHRNLETEPWKWTNGTLFNNWFEVHGGGECGYMNHKFIRSFSCTTEERWICSKPAKS